MATTASKATWTRMWLLTCEPRSLLRQAIPPLTSLGRQYYLHMLAIRF